MSQFLFNSFSLLSNGEKKKEKIASAFVIASLTESFWHGKQTNRFHSGNVQRFILHELLLVSLVSSVCQHSNLLQKAHSQHDEDKFILSTS